MNIDEIKALRGTLAEFGFERTPDEAAELARKSKLEKIKKNFQRIQPDVEELQNKLDLGIIDLSEMAVELNFRFGTEFSEDQCRHILLMNKIFQYGANSN